MNPVEAIGRVLIEHGPELCEEPNPLLCEWLVIAIYLDDEGEPKMVIQPSDNQLRPHTMGLIAMAQEEV